MDSPNLIPEAQNLIVIATMTVREAEKLIESCEHCNPTRAELPFDWILDQITGSDSTTTDYILETLGKCPHCLRPILEKTLVEPTD